MRRFEFVAGSSYKFWEISQAGRSVTVRWGRIGTDGQNQRKDFHSDQEAQLHVDRLIAAKVKKGYTEVSAVAA